MCDGNCSCGKDSGVELPGTCPACGSDLTQPAAVAYRRSVAAVTHAAPGKAGTATFFLDESGSGAPASSGEDWSGEFECWCTKCSHVLLEQSMDWG